jgi:hypothetical protein
MKKLIGFISIFLLAAAWSAAGQVDLGISIADGKLRHFYLAVGDYYHVPGPQIVAIRDRYRLHDEELPVVFFLAARADVAPSVIMDIRHRGRSWLDISIHFGLDPNIFYVPIQVSRIGPPYGKAYGYYGKYRARGDWRKIVLTDREVVDLVNLRFMSDYHGISPESVMERRARGAGFVFINADFGSTKAKKGGPWDPDDNKGQKNNGKGKRK